MANNWSGGLVEWIEDDTVLISVVFSWQLEQAYQRAVWHRALGLKVRAGGPAVKYRPSFLQDVASIDGSTNALFRHNPNATFTSRGCVRSCPFCIVPKIEGELIELDDWPVRPIVCDNNFLACSRSHFDNVIDKLKPLCDIDFNQGLDARLLTLHQAERLRELDLSLARLAWDHIVMERQFLAAFELLRKVGFSSRKIRVYVLIGHKDTPEDALYRLRAIKDLGAWPFPMRYQPLDCIKRNDHIGEHWTERQLKDYMRYWSRLHWLKHIPFEEYSHRYNSGDQE